MARDHRTSKSLGEKSNKIEKHNIKKFNQQVSSMHAKILDEWWETGYLHGAKYQKGKHSSVREKSGGH